MNIDTYQDFCPTTFIKGDNFYQDLNHVKAGVVAEMGEVFGAYQKYYRGDYEEDVLKERLSKEIGGLMYYLCMLCNLEGINMSEVLTENRDILIDRQNRDVIRGDGDSR